MITHFSPLESEDVHFYGKIRIGKSGVKIGLNKECTKQEKGRAHADLLLTHREPDWKNRGDPDR